LVLGYTWPMPTLKLDCSELPLADVDELSAYLDGLPGVEVPVSFSTETEEHDGTITIHASAEQILVAVKFAQAHWTQVTGGATAVGAVYKAGKWIAERIAEWNNKRNDGFEFIPIYDKDSNVVSVVKRRKS